jgi:hypothetical protein
MPRIAILDPAEHRHLRVWLGRGVQFGEDVHFVPITANELPQAAVEFPLYLVKDPGTGKFGLGALLGLSPRHNAYLDGSVWRTRYLPLHIRRQPFLVSEQREGEGAVAIDLDSNRVGIESGERLFTDAGDPTVAFKRIQEILVSIMQATRPTAAFVDALIAARLVRRVELSDDDLPGDQVAFDGLYRIDTAALRGLRGERLERMHEAGHLFGAHLLIASQANLVRLAQGRPAS